MPDMNSDPDLAIYAKQDDLAYFCAQLTLLFPGPKPQFIGPSSIVDQRDFNIQRTDDRLRKWAEGVREQDWQSVIGRTSEDERTRFYGIAQRYSTWQSIDLPKDTPRGATFALGAIWCERILCYMFCPDLPPGPPDYLAMPWAPRSHRLTAQITLPAELGGEAEAALPASFDDMIRS